jgi:hypothetical protein
MFHLMAFKCVYRKKSKMPFKFWLGAGEKTCGTPGNPEHDSRTRTLVEYRTYCPMYGTSERTNGGGTNGKI